MSLLLITAVDAEAAALAEVADAMIVVGGIGVDGGSGHLGLSTA